MAPLIGIAAATPTRLRRVVGVEATGINACPCAQGLVRGRGGRPAAEAGFGDGDVDRILELVPLATHNQRGRGTLFVGTDAQLNAEELVGIVERSMSSPVYELLKRPDELFVVEHAHLQPRFVEDSVRAALSETLERYPELDDDDFVLSRQVNFETIHDHDVVAERSGTVGELRGGARARRRRRRATPSCATGSWLSGSTPDEAGARRPSPRSSARGSGAFARARAAPAARTPALGGRADGARRYDGRRRGGRAAQRGGQATRPRPADADGEPRRRAARRRRAAAASSSVTCSRRRRGTRRASGRSARRGAVGGQRTFGSGSQSVAHVAVQSTPGWSLVTRPPRRYDRETRLRPSSCRSHARVLDVEPRAGVAVVVVVAGVEHLLASVARRRRLEDVVGASQTWPRSRRQRAARRRHARRARARARARRRARGASPARRGQTTASERGRSSGRPPRRRCSAVGRPVVVDEV